MSLVEHVDVEAEVLSGLWEQRAGNKKLNKINLNQWLQVDLNAYTNNKMEIKQYD